MILKFFIFVYLLMSGVSVLATEKTVDTHCYLNKFNDELFPWPLGDCLNIEEVFKNLQYDETFWDNEKSTLIVKHYESGKVLNVKKYQYVNLKLIIKD